MIGFGAKLRKQVAEQLVTQETLEASPSYRFESASAAFERAADKAKEGFFATVPRDEGVELNKALMRVFRREVAVRKESINKLFDPNVKVKGIPNNTGVVLQI